MDSHFQVKSTYISKKPSRWAVPVSLGVLTISFCLSILYWNSQWGISQFLAASRQTVFNNGDVWRLWTSCWIHSDLDHFLANSLMLGVLGILVGGYFGYVMFPLAAFLFGGLINAIVLLQYPNAVTLVGASGVVYLLAGFWLVMYLFIDRKYPPGKRLLRAFGVGLALLFPTSFVPNVSYLAHFVGFLMGTLLAPIFFFLNKTRIRNAEVLERLDLDQDDDPDKKE